MMEIIIRCSVLQKLSHKFQILLKEFNPCPNEMISSKKNKIVNVVWINLEKVINKYFSIISVDSNLVWE